MNGERRADGRPAGGLSPDGPLSRSIGSIIIAVRPPDLLLCDRISGALNDLRSSGMTVPRGSFLGVRTIDGFAHFKDLEKNGDRGLIDCILVKDYDPLRRTFTLTNDGSPDEATELLWFFMKTFPDDRFVFGHTLNDRQMIECPPETEKRIEGYLALMKESRANNPAISNGIWSLRSSDLGSLIEGLKEHLKHR